MTYEQLTNQSLEIISSVKGFDAELFNLMNQVVSVGKTSIDPKHGFAKIKLKVNGCTFYVKYNLYTTKVGSQYIATSANLKNPGLEYGFDYASEELKGFEYIRFGKDKITVESKWDNSHEKMERTKEANEYRVKYIQYVNNEEHAQYFVINRYTSPDNYFKELHLYKGLLGNSSYFIEDRIQ